MPRHQLILGDCLEKMPNLNENSIDSIVTDPPYGLSFMGKSWDHGVPGVPFWEEALRVAKPGCHLLAFGGTRTFHRLVCSIEDAGWEIRDCLAWVYGSGFPKSLDVSKAIDKAAGVERDVLGTVGAANGRDTSKHRKGHEILSGVNGWDKEITTPATDAAKQWSGWGTALKPSFEPIILARKPLEGTVAANVLKWGTGALNIDGCRVCITDGAKMARSNKPGSNGWKNSSGGPNSAAIHGEPSGRFPANLIHDGSEEVLEVFPETTSGGGNKSRKGTTEGGRCYGVYNAPAPDIRGIDSGSAARFFYCAKASNRGSNTHPTVKPLKLCRYLVKLVTPPNGRVLDPFMGSGTTGKAALREGFYFTGIELEEEYFAIAKRRMTQPKPPKTVKLSIGERV